MEWVETTGKTIEAAREAALDQLGVGFDDAEFDIVDEPKPGLFGRVRGEARIRARIRPTQARPRQERRRRSGKSAAAPERQTESTATTPTATITPRPSSREQETTMIDQPADTYEDQSPVSPQEVGAAAVEFMDGLTMAFGMTAESELSIDETVIDVQVVGSELGLLVGPGGRTLSAVQDLVRVAAQRRLGDHETRLRIDVAGYRQRREVALASFARQVAEQVRSSGVARSLEPMTASDRKVVHDVLNEEASVSSRSIGEDPDRRIIVEPA